MACDSEKAAAEPEGDTFRHQALYEKLSADAESFTMNNGDWVEDWGDAAFYGFAFYTWEGAAKEDVAWLARAERARAHAVETLTDVDLLKDDVNEIAMSALGLIDYMAATGDKSDLATLEAVLERLNGVARVLDWYLDLKPTNSWAFETFGPTTVTGLVALLNLQYVHLIGGEYASQAMEAARGYDRSIAERALAGSFYKLNTENERLFLYPNVTMIIFHARMYQQTGDQAQRERAVQIFNALEPLRMETGQGRLRYESPYSAETQGAKTHDYSTLSSQNYLMFALMLLGEITGDATYLREMDSVLDSIADELYGEWCYSHVHLEACESSCSEDQVCVGGSSCQTDACQGGVLHHWIDGRVAQPHDVDFFCSGCNLQLLYLMWYRQARVDALP